MDFQKRKDARRQRSSNQGQSQREAQAPSLRNQFYYLKIASVPWAWLASCRDAIARTPPCCLTSQGKWCGGDSAGLQAPVRAQGGRGGGSIDSRKDTSPSWRQHRLAIWARHQQEEKYETPAQALLDQSVQTWRHMGPPPPPKKKRRRANIYRHLTSATTG